MAEYINRAELISNLKEFANEQLTPLIENLIQKQPTADVVEVRHGTWIANRSPVEVEFSCSECGFSYIEADSYQECDYNFCPKCGARMDGDTE